MSDGEQVLSLVEHGAQLFHRALGEDTLEQFEFALGNQDCSRPGERLYDLARLRGLLQSSGGIGRVANDAIGGEPRPVRMILFDKRADLNWALDLHQDRTIAVKHRVEVEGFDAWTTKSGQLHVQPPQAIVEKMVTLRVHLDDVSEDNAPLIILPGSHLCGRLTVPQIAKLAARVPPYRCRARRGDIWAYNTAIVHGSAAVGIVGKRRRVLQIDYARETLPGGLQWAIEEL